jgi:hypothetical protein
VDGPPRQGGLDGGTEGTVNRSINLQCIHTGPGSRKRPLSRAGRSGVSAKILRDGPTWRSPRPNPPYLAIIVNNFIMKRRGNPPPKLVDVPECEQLGCRPHGCGTELGRHGALLWLVYAAREQGVVARGVGEAGWSVAMVRGNSPPPPRPRPPLAPCVAVQVHKLQAQRKTIPGNE